MGAYNVYKSVNENTIVLIRVASYCSTYDVDALIMKKIFSLKLNGDRVNFHIKSLNEVLTKLDELSINHILYWKDIVVIKKEYDNNTYNNYVYEVKNKIYKDDREKQLLNKIEYLIKNNNRNYEVIKKFIDGL